MAFKRTILWIFFFFVFWGMLLLAMGKIMLNEGVKLYEFFKFLTNISWSLQTVFYFFSLVYFFDTTAFRVLLFTAFYPIFGLTILVYILVNVIFQYSPDILTDNFENHSVGTVVTFNSIFHGVTVLLILVYGLGYRKEILTSHGMVSRYIKNNVWKNILLVLYQAFAPIFILFVYDHIVDPHDVYNVEIPDWIAWAIAVFTCSLLSVVYLMVINSADKLLREQSDLNTYRSSSKSEPILSTNTTPIKTGTREREKSFSASRDAF